MHFVYILECSDHTLYVGCTNDLARRLKQHNNSKRGAHYTKIRRPVELKYSETFDTLGAARAREAEIKTYPRAKKLTLFNNIKRTQKISWVLDFEAHSSILIANSTSPGELITTALEVTLTVTTLRKPPGSVTVPIGNTPLIPVCHKAMLSASL